MAGSDSHIWRSGGPESLDDWLSKNQPSKISSSSPDTDGFLWVLGPSFDAGDATGNDALPGHCADSDAVAKAKEVFEHALEAAQSIKDDPKIPVRANKKDGKLSKKQFRDVVCGQTKRKLEAIAKDAQLKGGKWLMFAAKDNVDYIWSKLARSVVDGPLSKLSPAKCHSISVATNDSDGSRGADTRLISIYFEDCFDAQHAVEVLSCIVAEHGESPSSVKADLWSAVGIDSTNALGLRSTLFQAKELMPQETIAELRKRWQEQHGEGAGGKKIVKAVAGPAAATSATASGVAASNSVADAKPSDDDGFESDEPTEVSKVAPVASDVSKSDKPAKVAKTAPALVEDDDFESGEASEPEVPRGTKRNESGAAPTAAKPPAPAKKKQKKDLRDAF